MQTIAGDIWGLTTSADGIVVPTNVGWKADGRNVMGRGLARQAARRWPELPRAYGEFCRKHRAATPIMVWVPPASRWCKLLVLFPVKPLNEEKPYLSWFQDASPDFIDFHLQRLAGMPAFLAKKWDEPSFLRGAGRILVPSVGCGNGGLPEEQIVPLLHKRLIHPCFVHVQYSEAAK